METKKFKLSMDLQTFAGYDDIVTRAGAEALIPEDVATGIIQGATEGSAVMSLATRLPNMATNQRRMPVLNSLPTAYFVNGDTGLKQTTAVDWTNKFLNVEELAVIVPIPDAVLDDAAYDLYGQIQPLLVQAFGKAIDQAILYGTNAPASWPTGVVPDAVARGNVVALGTGADLYEDIMGQTGVIARVEEDGFMVNGHVSAITMRSRLRGLRDANGQPIFSATMQGATPYALDGEPMIFPQNGAIDPAQGLMISGDYRQLVYSIRQDLTIKTLDQAVIQDNTGAIIYNLAQQDMKAIRCVMRLAWQLPNPQNNVNADNATRYPFAVLRNPSA